MGIEEIIRFEKLTKHYGDHIGIDGLDLSIKKGEIYGFLGPNGAGKTTSIRLMLDLLKPSSGSVKIFGKEVRNHSPELRSKIGYLPGNFNPFDKMTGWEFLQFSSKLRKLSPSYPAKLCSLFDLTKKELNKKMQEYSQGMKQKIGIIHAVAHKPELIILDEPSTGLDPLMQDSLYDLLLDLNKEGSTIFFSSHNLPEVEKICEKVAIVKDGLLVGNESLESLRKKRKRKIIFQLTDVPEKIPELLSASFISAHKGQYEYLITGNIQQLNKELSDLPISDLVIPEPNLEDIFLSYYEKEKKSNDQ